MTQQTYPPPPPFSPPPPPPPQLPPGVFPPGEFHLPRTNIFRTIRAQLAALERPPYFKNELEPMFGFLTVFVLAALIGTLIPLVLNTAIKPMLGQAAWISTAIIAPIIEETSKALCMIIVVSIMPRMVPNRRYGAALGAVAGVGFEVMENLVYALQGAKPVDMVLRFISIPVGHTLFSAFVGIGVFVFAAKRPTSKSLSEAIFGLPLLFLVIGIVNHAGWNFVDSVLPQAGGILAVPNLTFFLALLIVSPIFLFILRDFLGGHFNFKRFFEPLPEPSPFYPTIAPPPPPPPSQVFPTCPTCRQPLAYIPEYNRMYCSRCKKYV